jgi:hypothetical protein
VLEGARGDILMVLRSALTIVDVSVVHPPSANTLSAALATVGGAAARCDALKRSSYSRPRLGTRLYCSPLILWPPLSAHHEVVA